MSIDFGTDIYEEPLVAKTLLPEDNAEVSLRPHTLAEYIGQTKAKENLSVFIEAARTGDTAPDAGEQEDFAALIRGRYKADFDARVQKILDGRLRGLRQENARLRQEREQRQEKARQAIESMAAQEEQVRQVYPEFRWQREMENPAFGRLVCAGVEPMAAYEVVHREDILRRAMAYSAKRATRQAARSIASVGRRPAENGGRCVGVTGSDPRGLTSRELADIRRRVMEGEKISF